MENTIIVLAGDNGLALGRHGLFGKQNIYDHSVHVPLIFYGPGIPRSKTTDAPTYTVDIYPTICELLGIDVPDTVLGESLKPVIDEDVHSTSRNYLYFVYKEFQRAVQKDGWKLIEYNVDGNRYTQLFNLEKDPMETRDLSDEASQIERLKDLRSLMLNAKVEYGDNVAPFNSFWDGF